MKIENVCKELENIYEQVGIVFHCDADGVCSAAQILKYFKNKGVETFLVSGELEEKTFEKLPEKYKTAVILDLPVDYHVSWLKRFCSAVIIDHHIPKKNLNDYGFIHFNPRFENPKLYISTSEICYEICKNLGVKNIKWISRIGGVGDRSIKGNQKEVKAVDYIHAAKIIKGENFLSKVAEILSECKDIEDFLSKKEFETMSKKVRKEINKWVEKFYPKEEVCFYEIETPYSIISIVANEIFDKYPEKTVIVYGFKDGVFKISGRSRKYNLGEIFHKAAKGIGKGGGHEVAAGARIDGDKIQLFISRLKKFLRE